MKIKVQIILEYEIGEEAITDVVWPYRRHH
jgi:hypothetical protein